MESNLTFLFCFRRIWTVGRQELNRMKVRDEHSKTSARQFALYCNTGTTVGT